MRRPMTNVLKTTQSNLTHNGCRRSTFSSGVYRDISPRYPIIFISELYDGVRKCFLSVTVTSVYGESLEEGLQIEKYMSTNKHL